MKDPLHPRWLESLRNFIECTTCWIDWNLSCWVLLMSCTRHKLYIFIDQWIIMKQCCGASPWLKLYTKIGGPQWSTYVPYCIKQQLLTRWLVSSQFIFSESRITYDSVYQTHLNGTPIFRGVFMTFSCQPYKFTPIILFCHHGIAEKLLKWHYCH
jgi:hypothetical protein